MKTPYIFLFSLLFFQFCSGQSDAKPECIEKLLSEKKYEYFGILELPNGEKVYHLEIVRPEKCMDCTSGSLYKDSLCTTVARFTVGRVPQNFVKKGYEKSWFLEKKEPIKKELKEENSQDYFKNYLEAVRYKIKSVDNETNSFELKKNDEIEISLENGMVIFRNGKKHNQYKLIPENQYFTIERKCRVAPCPSAKTQISYIRWDDWGIIFNEPDKMMVYDFEKHPKNSKSKWEELYEIQKITRK